jgi:hypothetical protein
MRTTLVLASALLGAGCEASTEPVSRERSRYEALLEHAPFSLSEAREATFASAYGPFHVWSGLLVGGGRVSRSEADWIARWDTIQTFHSPKLSPPPIDFSSEMVILFATGGAPSSGYDARIRHVTLVRDTLFVLAEHHRPAAGCGGLGVETAPSDARVVPRAEFAVVFLTAPFVRECDPLRTRPDW